MEITKDNSWSHWRDYEPCTTPITPMNVGVYHCYHSNPGVKVPLLEIESQLVLNSYDYLYFCFLSRPFPKAIHILFKVPGGTLSTFLWVWMNLQLQSWGYWLIFIENRSSVDSVQASTAPAPRRNQKLVLNWERRVLMYEAALSPSYSRGASESALLINDHPTEQSLSWEGTVFTGKRKFSKCLFGLLNLRSVNQ